MRLCEVVVKNIRINLQEIKESLAQMGWNQKDLSEKTGIKETTLSYMKKKKTISPANLKKLAAAFNKDERDFLNINPDASDDEKIQIAWIEKGMLYVDLKRMGEALMNTLKIFK